MRRLQKKLPGARGTPRIANRLLRRVRDYAQVKTKTGAVTSDIVEKAMLTLGIDSEGLDQTDRKFLRVMSDHYQGGPAGVDAIAATLNEEVDTIVDVVEPFLLKKGFVKRTQRGRELTNKALAHLKIFPSQKNDQQKLF